ncbi:MAG: methionyl-tRNA formyltransferase, partial [Pseudomonadota bacterium]
MALRIVFMGTPDFSVPALEALLHAGHDLAAVYSQPPRRSGRGMKETPSPVHSRADAAGIPVFTPTSLKPVEAVERFRGHDADVAVVVAYGMLLPETILDAPGHGALNIHASLLPRWRGAAPIHRAILAGDTETGISIMKMDAGLDTGPVALTEALAIGADETVGALHDRLASLGGRMIVSALDALESGTLTFVDQPAKGVTYAHKIDKAEALIDWRRSSTEVHNQIRGLSPFPGAWCAMPIGDR